MVFESYYNFKNLTAGSVLAQDLSCLFSLDGENFNTQGMIVLEPDCSIIIKSESYVDYERFESLMGLLSKNTLKITTIILDEQKISVSFTKWEWILEKGTEKGKITLTFAPQKIPFLLKGDARVKILKIYFHLFDFKSVAGTSIELTSSNNIVEIIKLTSDKWTVELHRIGTIEYNNHYPCLTHVGCFYRTDGSMFNGYSAQQMLNDLELFFTFCHGSFCNPKMPVGFDDEGNKVWALGDCFEQPVKKSISWFDQVHPEQLIQLFPKFMSKLEDKKWKETLNTVIYWYARSSNVSANGIDTAIVLTQIAMEKLSYEYVVNDKKMISSNGFDSLKAPDKLRLFYANLDIPIDIPHKPTKIQEVCKIYKTPFEDSFVFLTEFRNNIVHAKHKKKNIFSNLYTEARQLGMWYLELAILKVCNYEGNYKNRFSDKLVDGKLEKLPWQK